MEIPGDSARSSGERAQIVRSGGSQLLYEMQRALTVAKKSDMRVRKLEEEKDRRTKQWEAWARETKRRFQAQRKTYLQDMEKLTQEQENVTAQGRMAASQMKQIVAEGAVPQVAAPADQAGDAAWEALMTDEGEEQQMTGFLREALNAQRLLLARDESGAGVPRGYVDQPMPAMRYPAASERPPAPAGPHVPPTGHPVPPPVAHAPVEGNAVPGAAHGISGFHGGIPWRRTPSWADARVGPECVLWASSGSFSARGDWRIAGHGCHGSIRSLHTLPGCRNWPRTCSTCTLTRASKDFHQGPQASATGARGQYALGGQAGSTQGSSPLWCGAGSNSAHYVRARGEPRG